MGGLILSYMHLNYILGAPKSYSCFSVIQTLFSIPKFLCLAECYFILFIDWSWRAPCWLQWGFHWDELLCWERDSIPTKEYNSWSPVAVQQNNSMVVCPHTHLWAKDSLSGLYMHLLLLFTLVYSLLLDLIGFCAHGSDMLSKNNNGGKLNQDCTWCNSGFLWRHTAANNRHYINLTRHWDVNFSIDKALFKAICILKKCAGILHRLWNHIV